MAVSQVAKRAKTNLPECVIHREHELVAADLLYRRAMETRSRLAAGLIFMSNPAYCHTRIRWLVPIAVIYGSQASEDMNTITTSDMQQKIMSESSLFVRDVTQNEK